MPELSDRIRKFKESSKENIPSLNLNTFRRIETSEASYSSVEDIMALLRAKATESLDTVILEDNKLDTHSSCVSESVAPQPACDKVTVLLKKLSCQLNVSQEQPEEVIRRIRERLKRNVGKQQNKYSLQSFHHHLTNPREQILKQEHFLGAFFDSTKTNLKVETSETVEHSWAPGSHGLKLISFPPTNIRSETEILHRPDLPQPNRIKSLPTCPDWRKIIEKEILSVRSSLN